MSDLVNRFVRICPKCKAKDAELKTLRAVEAAARKLLWLRHGCPLSALYGDDGEMQCGSCLIDFKRDSFDEIGPRFETIVAKLLKEAKP